MTVRYLITDAARCGAGPVKKNGQRGVSLPAKTPGDAERKTFCITPARASAHPNSANLHIYGFPGRIRDLGSICKFAERSARSHPLISESLHASAHRNRATCDSVARYGFLKEPVSGRRAG